MEHDEFQLLASRLVYNKELDPQDRPHVKKIVYQLSLDEETSPRDQNDRWAVQQRMEAAIIYLVSRYSDMVTAAKRSLEDAKESLDDAKDEERLTLPEKDAETNRKYNKEDREALIDTSGDVRDKRNLWREKRDQLDALLSLVRDLEKLDKSIIRRNDKINDVSINIRRENEVDDRA